jgi:hypothetical protein
MSTIKGRQYSNPKNINLKGGILRFGETKTSNPLSNDSTGYGLYVDSSYQLTYWNGTSITVIGAGGGGGTPTWETLYAADATFTINSGGWTIAGNASAATDVLTLTADAGTSGDVIQITNSGTGNDIQGTSNTWKVTKAGVITCAGLTLSGANTITTTGGDITWTLEDNDATALSIGSTGATAMMVFVTTDNSETVTFGNNITLTDGKFTGTSTSNTAPLMILQNDTITTFGNGATEDQGMIVFSSDTLTTGDLLRLQLDESALNGGAFIKCVQTDAAAAKFTVAENGVTTIAGAGGSNALVVTAGDVVFSDASIALTDADNAATLTVTNNTATTASVVVLAGSGVYTGSKTTSWMTITPSGLTTGTGIYAICAGLTTGKVLDLATDATMTTGTILNVQCTGADDAVTSGKMASFDLTATAITSSVNKIGSGVSVTSSRTTTTGTVADDWDLMSLVRTDIINGAGSMSAAGSVLYIENAVTNTVGTVTDTTNGIELVMDSLGTGDGVKITHGATGGKALNVVSAATTVSDVLVTGSGAKADNKACIEATNSGATAAGGSILRISNTGTPAAATSYLVDFDYTGATMTNNPVAVIIQSAASTATTLQVTDSGAKAAGAGTLELINTNAGALGAVLKMYHSSASPADNDVIARLDFYGTDDGPAAQQMAKIDLVATDVSAASEDCDMVFYVARAGTVTESMRIDSDLNGLQLGDGAATAYVSSNGAFDLVLETNGGTNSGTITITDGANGDITLTPNGTGNVNLSADCVMVGDNNANAIITTDGTGNLTLGTNSQSLTNSGTIVITQGANANIVITPNGTGKVDLGGGLILSEIDAMTGAGAVSTATVLTTIDSAGADALTLADGTTGQIKIITMIVDDGEATLTPANPGGFATIKFNDVGDSCMLIFVNSVWQIVSHYGCTIA